METEKTDILSESEIASRLTTEWAGRTLHFFPVTDSTNIAAKRYAAEGEPHGTVIVADMQSAGRGRMGRQWQSPAYSAIYMSILLRPEFAPDKASMLTLVMALGVTEAVTEMTGLSSGIKWPNDIVINRKKVCGILTEMDAAPDGIRSVVIGAGVNVNNESPEKFPEEIRQSATSLAIESGLQISRAALIGRILAYFEKNYNIFIKTLDLSALMEAYNARLLNLNAQVKVLDPKGEYTGTARGINPSGELLVERENGEVHPVYAGEVSVRGLYGYV